MKLDIILRMLRTIEEVSTDPNRGICCALYSRYHEFCFHMSLSDEMDEPTRRTDLDSFLEPYFRRWPKFSGNIEYPVPHPELNPYTAYNEARNLWDRDTEYGRNRWDLLEFIIAEIEKEIQEGKS